MFTCESPSQVFCFIFNLFGKAAENFSRLKALGYDRTCDFHPFLERLANRGNLGAQLLLSKVKFLVDKFHCEKQLAFRPITQGVNTILIWNDFQKFRERIQSALSNFSNGWGHLNTCAKKCHAIGMYFFVECCGHAGTTKETKGSSRKLG